MTRWLILALLLSSCGTYHLTTEIIGPDGDRRTLDILSCKDAARTWSARAEAQARGFATGFFLPVVGIVIDAAAIKADRRAEFERCMAARGYVVVVGRD